MFKTRFVRIVLSLPFLIVAGLFGLYLIFGFFLVNPLAQKLLPWVGETKLGSRLSAQKVSFNPLTLEAAVDGLKLSEQNGRLLAGFDRLYLNIGTTGLFRWALRVQDVQLQRPQVAFVLLPEGKTNWSALTAKLGEGKSEGKKEPSGGMARALIDHIKIADGDIEFTDAAREGPPFKAALKPLGIELDRLSTLLDDRGNYRIEAQLPEQGGAIILKGDLSLNPLSSKGEIALAGIRLADLQRADKVQRNFEVSSGMLAADLRYRFAMAADKTGAAQPSISIDGAGLSVLGFALAPRGGGAPVLQLAEARIGGANLDLTERRVGVASVSLTGCKLAATRDAKGTLDWQTMFAPVGGKPAAAPDAQPATEKGAPAQPWKVDVREIRLADWAAHFTDRGFAKPLAVKAEGFGMTAALSGEAGAVTAIEVGPVNAALGPVRVLSGTEEAAVLQRAGLVNAKLNLADNRLVIEAVELKGLNTRVILDKDKALNWTEILKKAPGAPEPAPAKQTAAKTAAADQKPGMDVQLARLSLDGIEVGITDLSTAEPVKLDITKGFVTAKNLSLDMNRAVPVQAGFGVKQGGNFSVGGSVIPGKASGRIDLKLSGFSLEPFEPYVNRFAKLDLKSGTVSTRGKLAFARGDGGTKLDFTGGFTVDKLAITEEETGEPFFSWEKLYSDTLEFKLDPNRLHMNELVADNPFAKVIIFEDKSINLKRIMRSSGQQGGEAEAKKAEAPKDAPKAEKPAQAPAFPVGIDRVRIISADAEFADLSLRPQFGTTMHDLSGVVTGISNDPATTALVELDGKVDEFGLARVRGSLQPFQATDFTDMRLAFRNLEMTRLTPYVAKFAGRKVDSGKLTVDLEYKIKQRQLAAENKVVINKIKLGERVDSPEALKLPLDLAIAILEDTNGVIDLDLPISGNLDDPEFSYGRIIWKALVNVLTKVVTAPFRALGNLLGIRSEKLEAVEFDAGAATLLPPEQEKLKEVGQALAKRPALALTVAPGYDPKVDSRALQELQIRRDVAARMQLRMDAGQEPGPVDVMNPRAQKALEDLYDERFAKQGGMKALRAEYEKAGKGPRPPHAEMLERLTAQIPVTEAELNRLAQARGESVKQALISLGKVDAARITVGAPVKEDAGGKIVASKMNLGTGK